MSDMATKQHILVDLDAILDTRLATLSKINQQAGLKALWSSEYYTRNTNDFSKICGISAADFETAWSARDVDTLKRSLPTGAIPALRIMMDDLDRQSATTPFAVSIRLVLNVFPYRLAPAEAEAMAEVMGAYSGVGRENVDVVFKSWHELTPSMIKNNYSGLILYNYREWMEIQQYAFEHARMPEITVLAPGLYKEREPTRQEIDLPGAEQMSALDITEGFLAGCYDLNFLDLTYFSVIPPGTFFEGANPEPTPAPVG
jgi:hypothetical protein